jgi:hypothetical protein
MPTGVLQHRRAASAARVLVTPADGEFFVDTDTYYVYIGDGSTAGGVLIGTATFSFVTSTKVADFSISSGDNGIRYNNIGAGGTVIGSLPAAAASLQFGGAVLTAQYLRFTADGTDTINFGGTISAAGGYIRSNVVGSSITIEAHGTGGWIISAAQGSWSVDA